MKNKLYVFFLCILLAVPLAALPKLKTTQNIKEKDLNDILIIELAKDATDKIYKQRAADGLLNACIKNFEMIRILRGQTVENSKKKYILNIKIIPLGEYCSSKVLMDPELCKVTVVRDYYGLQDLESFNCFAVKD